MSTAEYYDDDDVSNDESSARFVWKIVTIVIIVLALLLNIFIIAMMVVRRTLTNTINKAIVAVAVVDVIYGVFVSPFFVENYVDVDWNRGSAYCAFYIYMFTFHDLFVPLMLILLSTYVSIKLSGANQALKFKKQLYVASLVVAVIFSVFIAIPAAHNSAIFMETEPVFREDCQSQDKFTLVLSYFFGSALLFCFSMSFLFSLCISGSPFLRDAYDNPSVYRQRWRLLLTLSLVNSFHIISGFLLNFKEVSKFVFDCCDVQQPYLSTNTLTYDIWSFVLLVAEPFLRPVAILSFYFKYISTDPEANNFDRRRGYRG